MQFEAAVIGIHNSILGHISVIYHAVFAIGNEGMHFHITGNGQGQGVGQEMQSVSLNQLLSQASGTAGSQVNNIGVLAILHGAGQNVFQVLVGGQLNLDAGLFFESGSNICPNLRTVSGLNSSNLNGGAFFNCGSIGLSFFLSAASSQGHNHNQSQQKCNDLLHSSV